MPMTTSIALFFLGMIIPIWVYIITIVKSNGGGSFAR